MNKSKIFLVLGMCMILFTSFAAGLYELNFDSFKNVSVSYVYEKKRVPVYDYREVLVRGPYCSLKNLTCYKSQYITESYISEYKFVETNKRAGISVSEKNKGLSTEIKGYFNIDKDNKIYRWNVPIGDRNFEEFGACRAYEVEKGICSEVNIDE